MNKPVSIALLAAGFLLLLWGFNASDSISSEISEAFTGSPSDKAIWLLLGGTVLAIVGFAGLVRSPRLA